jgi:hypothetical protein
MRTEHQACSEAGGVGSNSGIEAPWSEPVSRSASEPDSASLMKPESGQAPRIAEASTNREAMLKSSGGTLRGGWGQRAGKVCLGRLGDPWLRFREEQNEAHVESIRQVLEAGESERPVVAMRLRSSRGGAKGPWQERCGLRKNRG